MCGELFAELGLARARRAIEQDVYTRRFARQGPVQQPCQKITRLAQMGEIRPVGLRCRRGGKKPVQDILQPPAGRLQRADQPRVRVQAMVAVPPALARDQASGHQSAARPHSPADCRSGMAGQAGRGLIDRQARVIDQSVDQPREWPALCCPRREQEDVGLDPAEAQVARQFGAVARQSIRACLPHPGHRPGKLRAQALPVIPGDPGKRQRHRLWVPVDA